MPPARLIPAHLTRTSEPVWTCLPRAPRFLLPTTPQIQHTPRSLVPRWPRLTWLALLLWYCPKPRASPPPRSRARFSPPHLQTSSPPLVPILRTDSCFKIHNQPWFPPTFPTAPSNVLASAGKRSAKVSWIKGQDGGSPLTSQVINVYSKGVKLASLQVSASAVSATISNLTAGVAYRFSVSAVNLVGFSPESNLSNEVIPRR